ncbi:synaptonemal complex protein 1 isoform X2 [Hyperolius riggenbachi]|uniref:synaptonemal complex protein 1 isoform X2 n=1 Tax=Hyperolius riggenbachi TaxID=752182 RepID=UPI0035A38DD3
MEHEAPFKIFPLPRLSCSHVSAVKPHTIVDNASSFFQNLKSPLGIENAQDRFPHKVSPLPVIEEENTESIHHLYSNLRAEAEKIKKWKSVIELEMKEKEAKMHEERKMADAHRKVIRELQIENEKLRLSLGDVRNENEDLVNQTNATRQICNLLKDTCDRAMDKGIILNNEAVRRQEMEKENNLELDRRTKQVQDLIKEKEDLSSKMSELKLQFLEYTNKAKELEEASKNRQLELEDYQKKTEALTQELKEVNMLLKNTKDALSSKQIQLQTAETKLDEANKCKEKQEKEMEETQACHAMQLSDLQSKIADLTEMLMSEQTKLQVKDNELKYAAQKTQETSAQLGELSKANDSAKQEIEQLRCDLNQSLQDLRDLEGQLSKAKSENQVIVEKEHDLASSLADLQLQFHNVVTENTRFNKLVDELQGTQSQMLETLKDKDMEINVLKTQMNASTLNTDSLSKQIEELKTEVNSRELKHADLTESYEKLAKEYADALKTTKASKQNDQTRKKIESLEQTVKLLRKENDALTDQMKDKEKQFRSQLNEYEEEKRKLENEFSKKEKQQKLSESKLCTMKKQVENKNKAIEELQQEIKVFKRKTKEGCKQCSVLEAEVIKLQAHIKNATMEHEAEICSKQMEIENRTATDEALREEVQKLKLASEEAMTLQRETDIKCQHKIAEMVALMEKHKHQYDKMIDEKDAELGQLRARNQETTCSKALLEKDLMDKNNEMLELKAQLQHERKEKEKIVKEKIQVNANVKDKEVQTVFSETPKQPIKMGNIQTSSSYSRRTMLADLLSQGEPDNKAENKDTTPRTSSHIFKNTGPKTYSVKTPPPCEKLPDNFRARPEDKGQKKRKVALEFEFNSDSSERTDILGLYKNDGVFKTLRMTSQAFPKNYTATPTKIVTETSSKHGLAIKVSAMKKKKEANFTAFPKVDRKRKMKIAEKLFR